MALVSKPPGIVPVRTWGFQSPARPCGIVGKGEIPEGGPAGRKPHWYNRPAINPRWVVPLAEAEELAVASLAPPTKGQSSQAPAELFRMHCFMFSSLIFPCWFWPSLTSRCGASLLAVHRCTAPTFARCYEKVLNDRWSWGAKARCQNTVNREQAFKWKLSSRQRYGPSSLQEA